MKILKLTLLGLSFSSLILAFAPTNFYRPSDVNLKFPHCNDKKLQLGLNVEYGNTMKSRDFVENKVPALRLYNETESSLAMLMGADPGTEINNLANSLTFNGNPISDDGIRGHFKLNGRYEQINLNMVSKYKLPFNSTTGKFELLLYIPFKYMEIADVSWNEITASNLGADSVVKNRLTNDFFNNVSNLGDGLDLTGFKRFSLSDIILQLWWYNDYKQAKEYLKNVRLNVRMGLSLPTGYQRDEDKALDFELGNDGAWGIPLSALIDLDFIRDFKTGLEFEMLFLLDNTKVRRLKTNRHQTDFLLLHKGEATKSSGITWKFNLFLQKKLFEQLIIKIAYQYFKVDSSKLIAQTNKFDYQIINTAQTLQERKSQNLIFQLNADLFKSKNNSKLKPQISLFMKIPIKGKRVIRAITYGAQMALNF